MKVVITGATGYIGREVLSQALGCSWITSVVAISRRDPGVSHAKLTTILPDDFLHYPPAVLSQIQDANACIYCLGTNIPIKPAELNRKVNYEYALATANLFAGFEHATPFHFVYLSGALPEKNPDRQLWFLSDNRKMRGDLENALIRLDVESRDRGFRVFIARPGFVQPKGAVFRTWLIGCIANAIMLPDLGAAMVRLARDGDEDVLVENDRLKILARTPL
ncbi:hypothetical protein A1O1_02115 [Capronia coronata CBS 617.96]|uniref:NAD(P)-binding domain-containing protein n=1 Tax=Capronia coronata CBS 617.96 TaxID=1182541 RepID=W9YLE0_9EURO|nr:uncharacterized protein A1O1_02115 [Capronia coronata CBS 617.96]EXJ93722.1 hypothetical protein A1O1_02115 [Capronia coronata CBS 617.96]